MLYFIFDNRYFTGSGWAQERMNNICGAYDDFNDKKVEYTIPKFDHTSDTL